MRDPVGMRSTFCARNFEKDFQHTTTFEGLGLPTRYYVRRSTSRAEPRAVTVFSWGDVDEILGGYILPVTEMHVKRLPLV